jgi:hypothetical protein
LIILLLLAVAVAVVPQVLHQVAVVLVVCVPRLPQLVVVEP